MSIFFSLSVIYKLVLFYLEGSIFDCIVTRSNIWLLIWIWKSLSCWTKKLKFSRCSEITMGVYFIGTRSRHIIFKVDHFPEFSIKRIVSLINLSLNMRFDWFRCKNCWRSYLRFSCLDDLGESSLFVFSIVLLFDVDWEPFFSVQSPTDYSFNFWRLFVG